MSQQSDWGIREASIFDAAAISEIYNQAVVETTASFDLIPEKLDQRVAWLAERDFLHPVIVAEDDSGNVLGWGALSPWSVRPAYDATVEISVYVDKAAHGRGIGTKLMVSLIELARAIGIHNIQSRICAENEVSLRMTKRLGFREVGVQREVGTKFGRLLDVVILEKLIGPADLDP